VVFSRCLLREQIAHNQKANTQTLLRTGKEGRTRLERTGYGWLDDREFGKWGPLADRTSVCMTEYGLHHGANGQH
jgi:hypothetical protein